MRRVLLPLIALLLAGASTFAVRGWLESQGRPATVTAEAAPEQRKAVLVAATDLAIGSFVQPDSVRWQDWPDVSMPESYLVRGASDETALVGAVVRRSIAVGQPITTGSIVQPGEHGFLAAVLEPGMRAISVPIDEASGNAGLVFPGDRVDVILTQTIEIAGDPAGSRRVSETVLENVRVLAVGRRLQPEGTDEGSGGQQARTATLETTPLAAERVALVTELGKLALSLRSLAVAEAQTPTPAAGRTWDTDVSAALRPENQPRSSLSVMRGDKLETVAIRRGAGS